jgi:exodeoxyribonuclease-3
MKLATWNINSLTVRLPQLLAWLDTNPVDVIVLQETKQTDDKFPHAELAAAGYHAHWFGQKTYNGVALLTRKGSDALIKNIPDLDDDQARVISATVLHDSLGPIRVIGAYIPNGQAPDSDKFVYKMRWLTAFEQWVKGELAKHPRLVLMGDFNIAPTDADVHDPARGRARSTARRKSATTFNVCWIWACTMPSGSSSSRPSSGVGGTTATWLFARTRACASTTSW